MATGRGTSQRRRRPARATRKRILVVTEGTRTEPQYVERLDAYFRHRGSTAVVKSVGVGKDPLKVVERCIQLRDRAANTEASFDSCVCLVDVDQHSSLEYACALAQSESIYLLVSNLKFEVWLRWHAERSASALTSAQLDQRIAKLSLLDGKTLAAGFPIESVERAYDFARRVDPDLRACRVGPDPSSAMPVLINILQMA